jgi:hypothetical protein
VFQKLYDISTKKRSNEKVHPTDEPALEESLKMFAAFGTIRLTHLKHYGEPDLTSLGRSILKLNLFLRMGSVGTL